MMRNNKQKMSASHKNPQSGETSASSSSSEVIDKKKNKEALPPLFWYMEQGEWEKAADRATRRPREARTWATLRTKSMSSDGSSVGSGKISGTKRLALHHACFKLRSHNTAVDNDDDDPFIDVCHFILLLIQLYPEAAGMRESRHGCLALHLAAFASCAPRNTNTEEEGEDANFVTSCTSSSKPNAVQRSTSTNGGGGNIARPPTVSKRSASTDTAGSNVSAVSGMTMMHAHEKFTGNQTQQKWIGSQTQQQTPDSPVRGPCAAGVGNASSANTNTGKSHRRIHSAPLSPKRVPDVSSSSNSSFLISAKREDAAIQVLNALMDAYPKGIRVDSEGGRLPLHTACAGRASPRVVSMLLNNYKAAARHRNKDGFLPLHLCAHWGVSHPNVAISLLKAYPDATFGRNRWERTPLEEALCMAGENGRPHQASLVRALRKHPSYWTKPSSDIFSGSKQRRSQIVDMDASIPSFDTSESDGDQFLLTPQNSQRKSLKENTDMPTLVKNLAWFDVRRRLILNPADASIELKGTTTRGGFAANALTLLSYVCERDPPVDVVEPMIEAYPEALITPMMPGAALPLHIACTWGASPEVVQLLVSSEPRACRSADEMGNLPLHCACFSGALSPVVDCLLRTYPKGVLARNQQGSCPDDICKRLRHENRKSVLALIDARKRRSSGSLGAMAMEALNLNDLHGTPKKQQNQHPLKQDRQENNQGTRDEAIEVAYNENGEKPDLLWV